MQTGCVAHFQYDVCGHRAHAAQNAGRDARLIARYHDNRHGLADGSADAEHGSRQNAGLCRRKHREERRVLMGGAERQRALIVAVRNRVERGFAQIDDGRQNHDAEQHQRRSAY